RVPVNEFVGIPVRHSEQVVGFKELSRFVHHSPPTGLQLSYHGRPLRSEPARRGGEAERAPKIQWEHRMGRHKGMARRTWTTHRLRQQGSGGDIRAWWPRLAARPR